MADNNRSNNQTVKGFLLENRIDSILWLTRLYIIFSTITFFIPLFGFDGGSSFKRVLIGSAAVSALRLHQRIPRIQFSIEFAKELALQDSFHYLIYSVLFLISKPATMALMPIFIFAVMHSANYTRKVLHVSQSNSGVVLKLQQLINKIENRDVQTQLLQFIATTEILMFFVSIILVLSGQTMFLLPFFYYRFLQLRYSSRRNPYSRLMFSQFRLAIDRAAYNPSCPGIIRKILLMFVSVVSRFSPATLQSN